MKSKKKSFTVRTLAITVTGLTKQEVEQPVTSYVLDTSVNIGHTIHEYE